MAGLIDHQPTRTHARAAGANSRHVTRQSIVCSFVSERFFFGSLFPELSSVDLEVAVRPFLTQSDTANRKRPFSTGFFWPFFLSSVEPISCSYRQSNRYYSFCALLRGGWCEGVLLYISRNRLAAQCFALSSRATARRARVRASWWLWAKPKAATATFVELHSAESRQSYSSRSRYWQHGIETARCFRRVIHAGEQN